MNYEALVPSLKLCRKMAEIGICQDGAELWWWHAVYAHNDDQPAYLITNQIDGLENYQVCIAPTLPRMLEELPNEYKSKILDIWRNGKTWYLGIVDEDGAEEIGISKHFPDAVARALIAVKEAK